MVFKNWVNAKGSVEKPDGRRKLITRGIITILNAPLLRSATAKQISIAIFGVLQI
jgi:hypothetical protein